MIWDYTYNRPLELSYPTEHDSESFRKEVDEWMDNNCLLDDVSKKSIKSSLEKVGYNLNEYMTSHSYNMIDDAHIREDFIVYMCLPYSSLEKTIPINTENNRLMGDVNILSRTEDFYWGGNKDVPDFDIYCRLFFCETEEDLWAIFADGVGDIDDLISYYLRTDKDNALNALLYIYWAKNQNIEKTIGKQIITTPRSIKDKVISIFKSRFFGGMYDEFFDDDNIEKARIAWNTGIVEIRQEFVRDEKAVTMLKKII